MVWSDHSQMLMQDLMHTLISTAQPSAAGSLQRWPLARPTSVQRWPLARPTSVQRWPLARPTSGHPHFQDTVEAHAWVL